MEKLPDKSLVQHKGLTTEAKVAISIAVCVLIGLIVWLIIHSTKGSRPASDKDLPVRAGEPGGPSGRYVGDLTFFGKVEATFDFAFTPNDAAGNGVVNFTVKAGTTTVKSSLGDSYTTSSGVLALTESAATLAELKTYHLAIVSAVYTQTSNTIDVKFTKFGLPETITLYAAA